MFERIGIVGLGLIGGSFALASRRAWPGVDIAAVDRDEVLASALASGVIDREASDIRSLDGAGLIVLAAPVNENVRRLAEIGAAATRPTIVTDVGSTKRTIVDAARALPTHVTFVGGHPLGGAAHSGLAAASADLFSGKPWIFTPDASTSRPALERLKSHVSALGATPIDMDAAAHDRLLAAISHLPQLVVTALMNVVGQRAGADGLGLAGAGLIDTTRLASSPGSVWADICATNQDEIGAAIDAAVAELQRLREALGDQSAIDRVFRDAAGWRSRLVNADASERSAPSDPATDASRR